MKNAVRGDVQDQMLTFSTLSSRVAQGLGDLTMFRTALGLGIANFILALAAGLFGFGIVSSEAWLLVKIFFSVFLAISVATFVEEFFFRRQTA